MRSFQVGVRRTIRARQLLSAVVCVGALASGVGVASATERTAAATTDDTTDARGRDLGAQARSVAEAHFADSGAPREALTPEQAPTESGPRAPGRIEAVQTV